MVSNSNNDEQLTPGIIDTPTSVPQFKQVQDIVDRFHLHINNDEDKTSDQAVALAVVKVESDLLGYYSSAEGLRDIQRSPHRGKEPKDVVALLMEEVVTMGRAECIKRGLQRELKGRYNG